MTIEDDRHYLKIEYAGNIIFNDTNTGIIHLSPNGYFKCKNNYDDLVIQSDKKGNITYQINGQDAQAIPNLAGKNLLRDAVQEIAKQKARKRS